MKRSVFIFFILIFLFVIPPFVSAQPPAATQVILNLDSGLNIEVPRIAVLEQGQDFLFSFHVYNITTGQRVDNSSTNCTYELFQHNGTHIFERENVEFVEDEWQILVEGGNFSRVGEMYYIADCLSIAEGGVIAVAFTVTPSGFAFTQADSTLFLTLLIMAFILFALCLYGGIAIPFKNKREGDRIISISTLKYAKTGLWFVAYIFFVWLLNLIHVASVNFSFLTQFTNFFEVVFKVMNSFVYPVFVLMLILMIVFVVRDIKLRKMLDRGLIPR